MREFGKIPIRHWVDVSGVGRCAKLVSAYLPSSPHTTMIGCFRVPVAYIGADLNENTADVAAALNELADANWLTYDPALSWVIIHLFLRDNPIENPNQGKAALKLLRDVPRTSTVFSALMAAVRDHGGSYLQPFLDGLESVTQTVAQTVSEPFRNQEQEKEQEQEQEPKNTLVRHRTNSKRGTRLPENFAVTDDHREFARKNGLPNPDDQIGGFRDHFRAKAGADGVKLDWDATFRNWLRIALQFKRPEPVNAIAKRSRPSDAAFIGAPTGTADCWGPGCGKHVAIAKLVAKHFCSTTCHERWTVQGGHNLSKTTTGAARTNGGA